jgi:hypothetical protein
MQPYFISTRCSELIQSRTLDVLTEKARNESNFEYEIPLLLHAFEPHSSQQDGIK